tara:strand:+ start:763 stop:930 length:168 start_codon:yes stop_codon:yes gene_type:complete
LISYFFAFIIWAAFGGSFSWRSTSAYAEEDQFNLKVKTLMQAIIVINGSFPKQIS